MKINQTRRKFIATAVTGVAAASVTCSSKDLKEWDIHQIVLEHPEVSYYGFQYIDWVLEGNDIIFLSRTAYDDEAGGAENKHDANFMTFHRIENFRTLVKKSIFN